MESLAVIFWLVAWALLASEASSLNDAETQTLSLGGYTYSVDTGNYLPSRWKTAIDCTKMAAGLGALEWVLLIITLVFDSTFPVPSLCRIPVLTASILGLSLYRRHTCNSMAAAPATAPMTEENKMNTMVHAQPIVQDPRYGGPQMV
jgi:hypothetical protein